MDNENHMTGRLRSGVRILDIFADDLIGGTLYEQAVGELRSANGIG